jgi:hypothetical protein
MIELQARWLLHEDGELEVAVAVANSLQEIREILVAAQKELAADPPARQPLRRMEAACAKFLHHHPGIDRRDFEKPVSDDELDDLYELRLEIAETAASLWEHHRLVSAQEHLHWIKFAERPRTPWLPPP